MVITATRRSSAMHQTGCQMATARDTQPLFLASPPKQHPQPTSIPHTHNVAQATAAGVVVAEILRVCLPALDESSCLEAAGDHECARALLMSAFQALLGTLVMHGVICT